MVGHYALVAYLEKILPDPHGFEDPHDPEVGKVKQAKHDRMVAEMELRHAEDERKNRERDAANEDFFRTWAPKTIKHSLKPASLVRRV